MKDPNDQRDDGEDERPADDVAPHVAAAAFVEHLVVDAAMVFEDGGAAASLGDLHLVGRRPRFGIGEHRGHAGRAQRGIGARAVGGGQREGFHEALEFVGVARGVGEDRDLSPIDTRVGLFAIGGEAEHVADDPSFGVVDGELVRIGRAQVREGLPVGVFQPRLLAFVLVELPDHFAAIADRVIRSRDDRARLLIGGLETDIGAEIDIGCVCRHVVPFVIG